MRLIALTRDAAAKAFSSPLQVALSRSRRIARSRLQGVALSSWYLDRGEDSLHPFSILIKECGGWARGSKVIKECGGWASGSKV